MDAQAAGLFTCLVRDPLAAITLVERSQMIRLISAPSLPLPTASARQVLGAGFVMGSTTATRCCGAVSQGMREWDRPNFAGETGATICSQRKRGQAQKWANYLKAWVPRH